MIASKYRLAYIVAAVLILPVMVLLHECGHYFSAQALGFSQYSLSYNSAPVGVAPRRASALTQAIPRGGGQLVSLFLVLIAAIAIWWQNRSEMRVFLLLPLASAVVFAEASRSLFMFLAHLVFSVWRGRSPLRGFDELSYFVHFFDGPPLVAFMLCLAGVAVPIGALMLSVKQLPERIRKKRVLAWLLVGTLAGYAWYFGLVGPLLLP